MLPTTVLCRIAAYSSQCTTDLRTHVVDDLIDSATTNGPMIDATRREIAEESLSCLLEKPSCTLTWERHQLVSFKRAYHRMLFEAVVEVARVEEVEARCSGEEIVEWGACEVKIARQLRGDGNSVSPVI